MAIIAIAVIRPEITNDNLPKEILVASSWCDKSYSGYLHFFSCTLLGKINNSIYVYLYGLSTRIAFGATPDSSLSTAVRFMEFKPVTDINQNYIRPTRLCKTPGEWDPIRLGFPGTFPILRAVNRCYKIRFGTANVPGTLQVIKIRHF